MLCTTRAIACADLSVRHYELARVVESGATDLTSWRKMSDRIDIDTLNSNLSIALLMSLEKVRSSLSVCTYNLI